ncbi:hypothetical protein Mc24_04620 [Thermotoga sp. Mc24]|nr:hypothetical protein Mc24_04620 [Thermotoga sp. Mc24]
MFQYFLRGMETLLAILCIVNCGKFQYFLRGMETCSGQFQNRTIYRFNTSLEVWKQQPDSFGAFEIFVSILP